MSRQLHTRHLFTTAALVIGIGIARAQEVPRFQSSVEVTSIDVTVVDGRSRPITDLTPGDFTVQVDGTPRRVVTADWVPLAAAIAERSSVPPPPPGYSTNANASGGRLIIIAVDQPNIRFGGAVGIRSAVNGFIDRLEPTDRIAVVGFGPGSPSTAFTADREQVKLAVSRMAGQRRESIGAMHTNIALSEAVRMQDGDAFVYDRVTIRECGPPMVPPTFAYQMCVAQVEGDAYSIALEGRVESETTVSELRRLLIALRGIDAPKTMVLISEGFLMGDQHALLLELGDLAAAARTSLYALKLSEMLFDITRAQAPPAGTAFDDRQARSEGLEVLTSAARGSLFNIIAAADSAFERIESELSGYYLLGVESRLEDKDGKPHPLRVEVRRSGVTVRSRHQVMSRPDASRPRTPRDAVLAGLGSPLLLSALPLRVVTFSLQGPEAPKIQLLIHADVGTDYPTSKVVALGYMITDREGRIVESQGMSTRLQPVMNGVPSPLQFTSGASLDPGEYTLKLAVAEGDRVGTVEHPIRADLVDAGGFRLSELMVGGPVDGTAALQPTVGHTVAFGSVHGYFEAYGPGVTSLKATFEIARDETSDALLTADVAGRPAGGERLIFTHVLPVRQLPPGTYVLRTIVAPGGGAELPAKSLVRRFEVAAPAVLMTSAEGPALASALPSELYLPVTDEALSRAYGPGEPHHPETLQTFRERVAPAARDAFDRGVALLQGGEYERAEASFKEAIHLDADSTAPLTYLAAVFAASGHDREAAGAWQTALIEGSDVPQIYLWLGDALMRIHELAQARTILEEAVKKWPADVRFTKPLALLYATFGQGREAVRTMGRYLVDHQDDLEALALGVEWIYNLRASAAFAHTPAEDLKLARAYAEAYEKAKGPQLPLVKQWMAFLDQR